MMDIVSGFWHRISRHDRHAHASRPRRTSFGETIAVGLGCDSRIPQPKRAKLG